MDDNFPILLAEDNAVSRMVLENILKHAGYEVVSVENGKKALEVMNERFFPMILTDWLMPEMDGLELCKAIRQNSNESPGYVFIILLTVKESQEDILTGLEAGADDYLIKPANSAELIARLKAGERILKLEKSLKSANAEIRTLSITDHLTGCYNRLQLTERLPHEIRRARRYNRPLSIALCDIDKFKKINDLHGHQVGDQALQEFSSCLRESIRQEVDWIIRYGGEEFLIVFPEIDIKNAVSAVKRLRGKISSMKIESQEIEIVVTACFGITGFDPDTSDDKISPENMIKMADKYLYQAKHAGPNKIMAGEL